VNERYTKFRPFTEEELIREVQNQDPLILSDLEVELAQRLVVAIDEAAETAPRVELLNDADFTEKSEVQTLLDTTRDVKALLGQYDDFDDIGAVGKHLDDVADLLKQYECHDLSDLRTLLSRVASFRTELDEYFP